MVTCNFRLQRTMNRLLYLACTLISKYFLCYGTSFVAIFKEEMTTINNIMTHINFDFTNQNNFNSNVFKKIMV
jgi:hypothetical protein